MSSSMNSMALNSKTSDRCAMYARVRVCVGVKGRVIKGVIAIPLRLLNAPHQ